MVRKQSRWLLVGILALGISSCSGSEAELPNTADETVRSLLNGDVIGFIEENGIHVWRGIPFADSTAGDNRWRAPRPAAAWKGVRTAVKAAPRCPQFTNPLDDNYGLDAGVLIGSEDCLTLDIAAPADAGSKELPVMVWIHGGSNIWGWSSQFDMKSFVRNQDVITVSVQYRLGPLGWFAHESLRQEAAQSDDAAASFAILDLVASLKWVRDNISAFGGDPGNVTLFGQSSGGHNIAALLVSPKANGLFHKAIIQSGLFESTPVDVAEGTVGMVENSARRVADKLSANTAEELRKVPLEALFDAYATENGIYQLPTVISDGVALPESAIREALTSRESFAAVPMIIGTNRDEMKFFMPFDEKLVTKRLWFFPVARNQQYYDIVSNYLSRLWRIRGLTEPAAFMMESASPEIYAYRFDWDDSGSFLFMDARELFGAAHSLEIPFVANEFLFFGARNDTLFPPETETDRQRLSRAMGQYWASFARTGTPSADGFPVWPEFETGNAFMRLDAESDGGIQIAADTDSFEKWSQELTADDRMNAEQRCHIVAHLAYWNFSRPIHGQFKQATGC